MKLRIFLSLIVAAAFALNANAQVQTFQRNKVLVEKHTGINCQYCGPADVYYLGHLARHPELDGKIITMRHNSYRSQDALSIPLLHSSLSSTWGVNGWPKFLIDRCDYQNGEHFYNASAYLEAYQVFEASTYNGLNIRYNTPTYVSLSLDGCLYDPVTREITVHASGKVTKNLPNLRFHAFLTQDDCLSYGTFDYENESSRACLNSDINGDPLTVTNGRYDVTLKASLAQKYGGVNVVPENMRLVVFVSTFNSSDFSNSEVHNADCVMLTELPIDLYHLCEPPTIDFANGSFVLKSSTPGAVYYYDIQPYAGSIDLAHPEAAEEPAFTVTAFARAEGYGISSTTTRIFRLSELTGDAADTDGNGTISISDLTTLIQMLSK